MKTDNKNEKLALPSIAVRLTESEAAEVAERAQAAGLSVSEHLRRIARGPGVNAQAQTLRSRELSQSWGRKS